MQAGCGGQAGGGCRQEGGASGCLELLTVLPTAHPNLAERKQEMGLRMGGYGVPVPRGGGLCGRAGITGGLAGALVTPQVWGIIPLDQPRGQ